MHAYTINPVRTLPAARAIYAPLTAHMKLTAIERTLFSALNWGENTPIEFSAAGMFRRAQYAMFCKLTAHGAHYMIVGWNRRLKAYDMLNPIETAESLVSIADVWTLYAAG